MQRSIAWTKISESWERILRNRIGIILPYVYEQPVKSTSPGEQARRTGSKPGTQHTLSKYQGNTNERTNQFSFLHDRNVLNVPYGNLNQGGLTQCCLWDSQYDLQVETLPPVIISRDIINTQLLPVFSLFSQQFLRLPS